MISALRKIAISFLILTLSGGYIFAQTTAAKSRLNIGKDPKKPTLNTGPVNSLMLKPNSKEIRLDKSEAVKQFYRDLLISKNDHPVQEKAGITANIVAESTTDKLFRSDKLVVNNIYPNPANEQAFLEYKVSGKFKTANITFYNLLGVAVADFALDKNDEKLRLSTSGWDPGIYMYQLVVDGKKLATKKLLVTRN